MTIRAIRLFIVFLELYFVSRCTESGMCQYTEISGIVKDIWLQNRDLGELFLNLAERFGIDSNVTDEKNMLTDSGNLIFII